MRAALVQALTWLMILASLGVILSSLIAVLRRLRVGRRDTAELDRLERLYIERGTEGTPAWRRRYVNRRRQREGRPPLE